jgi:hypothetical protein
VIVKRAEAIREIKNRFRGESGPPIPHVWLEGYVQLEMEGELIGFQDQFRLD